MSAIKVTASTFKAEVLDAKGTVIVDFWAEWCGPCRMIAPILEEIAAEHPDFKICKVNVDEEPELATRYSVVSIPMIVRFDNGKITGETVGLQPKSFLLRSLEL